MISVKPSFYDSFSCIASTCRHSCCVGWEIDIDQDTRDWYEVRDGEIGALLRRSISDEPSPHFVLDASERCPMLRDDGLCRLILELGEDALCDICALHPRFFNSFPGREESGLGLCCEEVVRLLLHTEEGFHLTVRDDGQGGERDNWVEELAKHRDRAIEILSQSEKSLDARLKEVFSLFGAVPPAWNAGETKRLFLSLEQMDAHWAQCLYKLPDSAGDDPLKGREESRYATIFAYLLYRHMLCADSMDKARLLLCFCAVSTGLVAALDDVEPDDKDEHLRLFSAEIEYSDENVETICESFRQ